MYLFIIFIINIKRNKLKILIFNTLYYPNAIGGAEKSVQALSEGLVKIGHQVVVVSTTPKKNSVDVVNGVKVYYVNTKNIYWGFDNQGYSSFMKLIWHSIDTVNFRVKRVLKNILISEQPEIVHTNNLSGFSTIVWKIVSDLNIQLVHTLRDYYILCPNVTMFKDGTNCSNQCYSCKVFSLPKKNYSKSVNCVVGISNYIQEKHMDMGCFTGAKHFEIIGNDVGSISPKHKIIDQSNIVFGYIGQLNESKGIENALSVFERIESDDHSNWTFLVAGSGNENYVNYLKKTFNSKNIEFLGKTNSDEFYNKIDVLIVPSLWQEPFGRVVVEGLKHEKYVLGSNRGGISELLDKEGCYDPDSDDLFNKIRIILLSGVIPKQNNSFDENVTLRYNQLYTRLNSSNGR